MFPVSAPPSAVFPSDWLRSPWRHPSLRDRRELHRAEHRRLALAGRVYRLPLCTGTVHRQITILGCVYRKQQGTRTPRIGRGIRRRAQRPQMLMRGDGDR